MIGAVSRVPELRSDCSSCFALCCVLLPFSADAGFGVDKPGGTPCLNLADDDRCRIHATLREDGWPGCTVFECFGAGQQVSQVTYGGVSWREGGNRGEMAAVLSVMRLLHESLTHLLEARERGTASAQPWIDRLTELVTAAPDALLALDIQELLDDVRTVLAECSSAAGAVRRRSLLAADLREADLAGTDLLGADCRDADVRGADLSRAMFLTQPQVNAMRGDADTRLPGGISRPSHW